MERRFVISSLLLFACVLAGLSPVRADGAFRIARVLQSNMVIQQGKPFTVWGNADPGDPVTLRADWLKVSVTVVTDPLGNWEGAVPVPQVRAGDVSSHSLEVIHRGDTTRMEDVLIGEVWICSGQSNMDFTLKPFLPWMRGVTDYAREIAAADYPDIRVLDIPTDFKAVPTDTLRGGRWVKCNPRQAGDFSAVAYYFGRALLKNLQVPIGLVVSAVGGASCEGFTSRKALSGDPVLYSKYLYPYDTSARSTEKLDTTVTFEKVVRPTVFYNAMIYPLRKLSIRGFIWYQGESNKHDGSLYTRLCARMLKGWRTDFRQGYLPFYFVQMTPYNWGEDDPAADYYARLREAQTEVGDLKNTGMAVTMDIGEPGDIHPRNKKDVGIRLARNALYRTYRHDIVYEGPRYSGFKVRGDTVVVSFVYESVETGLSTRDGKAPRCFFLAGTDRKFYPAEAVIMGDQVHLHSGNVQQPVAVRYAFTNYPVTNFCNKEGLPALPFRTDGWQQAVH